MGAKAKPSAPAKGKTCLRIGHFKITKFDEFRGGDVQRLALIVLEGCGAVQRPTRVVGKVRRQIFIKAQADAVGQSTPV